MTGKDYFHAIPPSLASRLIQFFMGLFVMKRAMEKKIANNTYNKKPARIPKSIIKNFNVEVEEFNGRKVWILSTKNTENNTVILFLHGGAYYANITPMHWYFIDKLLVNTKATFIVPDYPLAPESTCIDTYQFLGNVYAKLIYNNPNNQIVFMGDSAGGGLALGFAMKIRNEKLKQPEQIIMYSPWLDVSMANPEIAMLHKRDKILSVNGLKIAGKKYAGDLDIADFRVSPIYGDYSNLGKITIFIGTNEVFIADSRKLKQLLQDKNIELNYLEYPGIFHDWVVVPILNETKDVICKISKIINPEG